MSSQARATAQIQKALKDDNLTQAQKLVMKEFQSNQTNKAYCATLSYYLKSIGEKYLLKNDFENSRRISTLSTLNDRQKLSLLQSIGKKQIERDGLDKAKQMLTLPNLPDGYKSVLVRLIIENEFIATGKLNQAVQYIKNPQSTRILNEYDRDQLLFLITEKYIERGEIEQVRNVKGLLSKHSPLVLILYYCAQYFLTKNNLDKVKQILKSPHFDHNSYRSLLLVEFLNYYLQRNEMKQALQQALQLVQSISIPHDENIAKSLYLIGKKYIELGDLVQAQKISRLPLLNLCEYKKIRSELLLLIGKECVERGDREKAQQISRSGELTGDDRIKLGQSLKFSIPELTRIIILELITKIQKLNPYVLDQQRNKLFQSLRSTTVINPIFSTSIKTQSQKFPMVKQWLQQNKALLSSSPSTQTRIQNFLILSEGLTQAEMEKLITILEEIYDRQQKRTTAQQEKQSGGGGGGGGGALHSVPPTEPAASARPGYSRLP